MDGVLYFVWWAWLVMVGLGFMEWAGSGRDGVVVRVCFGFNFTKGPFGFKYCKSQGPNL